MKHKEWEQIDLIQATLEAEYRFEVKLLIKVGMSAPLEEAIYQQLAWNLIMEMDDEEM